MIRNSLSQIFTFIASQLIPTAKGDEWGSPVFTPEFKEYQTLEPCQQTYDDPHLEVVSCFHSIFYFKIFTDKLSPFDPQLLNIHFRQHPIVSDTLLIPDTNTIKERVKSGAFKIEINQKPALIEPIGEVQGTGIVIALFNNNLIEEYILECYDATTPQAEVWRLTDINGNVIDDTITTKVNSEQTNINQGINVIAGEYNFQQGDKFSLSVLGLKYKANVTMFSDVTSQRAEITTILAFEIKHGWVLRKKVHPIYLPEDTIYIYVSYPPDFDLGEYFSDRVIVVEPTDPQPPSSTNVILLSQTKITIEKPIINGIFDIRNSVINFYSTEFVAAHPTNLGDNIDEFNDTPYIMVFLNGQMLEKGVQILYTDDTHFQYVGTVDANDVFTVFGK